MFCGAFTASALALYVSYQGRAVASPDEGVNNSNLLTVRFHCNSYYGVDIMWRNLFRRPLQPDRTFDPIAPDAPFLVIGDLHGRADLLQRFFDTAPDFPIVCVGDYVDRGPDSAAVLRMLHARPDVICISGNHEAMLLRFLDSPEDHGRVWMHNGGLQTLASFGVSGLSETSSGPALRRARDQLYKEMGTELIDWLRALPTYSMTGNFAVVHAGADPALPISSQSKRVLHWGHPAFVTTPRSDGVWVIHGHTIVAEPQSEAGRIAIDTGAYATGRLTAALIGRGAFEFETV